MSAQYIVQIHPQAPEDGTGYIATVPGMPGCMGDGETRAEALADVERAMAEWMDEARRLGRA